MNCVKPMCEPRKVEKYLNDEGLLFFTQMLHDRIQSQIKDAINDAVAAATIVPNSSIIDRINQLLSNGTITTADELNAKVAELKDLINKAKKEAANDAMVALSANIKAIVDRYAYEYLEANHNDVDIDELVDAILNNANFKGKYVKKTGDTVTGNLVVTGNVTVEGNTTSDKFVTSSGIIFF